MSRSLCFFSSLKSHSQTYRHTHPKMKLVALSTFGAIAIAAAQQFVPLTVGSLILFLRNVFLHTFFSPEKKEVFPVDPASLSGTGVSAATAQQQQQQLLVQQQPETLVQQQQQLLVQQQPETLVEIPACTYEARQKKNIFEVLNLNFTFRLSPCLCRGASRPPTASNRASSAASSGGWHAPGAGGGGRQPSRGERGGGRGRGSARQRNLHLGTGFRQQ